MFMMIFPDLVPRKIEKATDSARLGDNTELRDWEPSAIVVTMAVRTGATVFRDIKYSAQLNMILCASVCKTGKLRANTRQST
jgi:hypothetical protein